MPPRRYIFPPPLTGVHCASAYGSRIRGGKRSRTDHAVCSRTVARQANTSPMMASGTDSSRLPFRAARSRARGWSQRITPIVPAPASSPDPVARPPAPTAECPSACSGAQTPAPAHRRADPPCVPSLDAGGQARQLRPRAPDHLPQIALHQPFVRLAQAVIAQLHQCAAHQGVRALAIAFGKIHAFRPEAQRRFRSGGRT